MTTSARPRLAVHDATGHRVVLLDAPVFTIGRRAGNHLQLTGIEVSRDHAEIVETSGGYEIRDRGSRYGTFVNGQRVQAHPLVHGDRIECGRHGAVLVFLVGPAAAATELVRSATITDLRQVAMLLDSLRAMGSDRVLDEVLTLVLDAAIGATGAERGFIMLPDAAGALEMKLARRAGGVTLAATVFDTSRKIPEDVFATGEMAVVVDLLEGDLPAVHSGTVAFGIRHVLCAPLKLVRYVERGEASGRPRNVGVLYLDSREKGKLVSAATRTALETLATEAATAIENARLYRQAIEKARLDEELRTAFRIQQALLPEPRRVGRFFQAVGASVPSRAIGGDFFDYLDMVDGALGFALGDVTGKGPAAALLTAVVQGILGGQARTKTTPAELIGLVNQVLLSRRVESRFTTIFFGMLSADGRLVACNAAQIPPVLLTRAGLRRLTTGGTLVGAFPDAVYEQEELRLVPGDTLVLFSDGITEAMNTAGEEFGDARVCALLERYRDASPEYILDQLFAAVREFARGATQHDDLTAVVVRYGVPA